MSSEWELDEGIKSIKSAWRREHTARANLEKMLEQAEAENAKLRELVRYMWFADYAGHFSTLPEHQEHQANVWQRMRELRVEVDG